MLPVAERCSRIDEIFTRADVDVFASTHTCLPALRAFMNRAGAPRAVVNNGAAGMPNFYGELGGLLTRISVWPSPHEAIHGLRLGEVRVDALAVPYDAARWEAAFLANWPVGSDAWRSYFDRIRNGPRFFRAQALPNTGRVFTEIDETTGAG